MMKNLLGIDIGTSGLKAGLFDETGRRLALVYRESVYLSLPPGHREQMPDVWWENLCGAVSEVLQQSDVPACSIVGIGLCGFHHCPVFLKANGEPARPVMLLHDARLPRAREEMKQEGILEQIETMTQSMVSAGHFPPVFYYIAKHDPEAIRNTSWILLAKDYIRFKLTGKIGTELCDATGTNLIEPGERSWSQKLCDILSVPTNALPEIACSERIAGQITDQAAACTGLMPGTPVVYGGGDSHCALLGLGCVNGGDTGLLLGTNSTLRMVFDRFVSHPETKVWVQHHVTPEQYTVSASSMAGASVLNWFRQTFYQELSSNKTRNVYAHLEKAASRIPPGSRGVLFLPYIYGERSPFYDPDTSGAFLGLKYWHTREDLLRSVFEGVALNIANCYELIEECAQKHDSQLGAIRIGGGGSQSTLWHQIMADCLRQSIHIMNISEAGSLGAALLAGIGIGLYASYSEAIDVAVKEQCVIEPNNTNYAVYQECGEKLNSYYRRIR